MMGRTLLSAAGALFEFAGIVAIAWPDRARAHAYISRVGNSVTRLFRPRRTVDASAQLTFTGQLSTSATKSLPDSATDQEKIAFLLRQVELLQEGQNVLHQRLDTAVAESADRLASEWSALREEITQRVEAGQGFRTVGAVSLALGLFLSVYSNWL